MRKITERRCSALLEGLSCGKPLSRKDRADLIECIRMVRHLQTDLAIALADVEGRIRDNNFLLIANLAQVAEFRRRVSARVLAG